MLTIATLIQKYFSTAVFIIACLILVYCGYLRYELDAAKNENKRVAVALLQSQYDLAQTREQYSIIREAIDSVAEQKLQSDKELAALRRALESDQKNEPCGTKPVPSAVSDRLRQRAAEINAAATDARKPVTPVPSP